jgi:iron complex outermembrane receptor protein
VDFSNTITHTGFVQFARPLGDLGDAKLEMFYDSLSNDRFVSYGFPASYRTQIYELRLSDNFAWDGFGGALKTNSVAGASYRYTHGIGKESFNVGVIALDRRDISVGAMPNDIIDSPFNVDPPGAIGLGWDNDVRTSTANAGLFLTSDIDWKNLSLILGGRYDAYNVRSVDKGLLPFEAPRGEGDKGIFTWSASVSYKSPFGLVPYVTLAKNAAVEIGQADQVLTSLFATHDFVSDSALAEAGVKFAFLDQHLVGSLSAYRQDRTQLARGIGAATVQGTRAKGEELEIRYVADRNWSFTLAGNLQHTLVKGATGFVYIPARQVGVSPLNGFGGAYVTFDYTGAFGGMRDYDQTLIPHAVISPYLTYTSDAFDWGTVGGAFGGSYVSRTMQTVSDPIVFPNYFTLNLSLFVRRGTWQADFNIDNLTDKLYFTPDADTYSALGALPGIGRVWRLTLKKSF